MNKDNIKKDKKIEQLSHASKEFYDILEDRNVIANDYKNANKSLHDKNKKQKEDIVDLRNKIDYLITENHKLKSEKDVRNHLLKDKVKKYSDSNKELIRTNKSYNDELENFKKQYNDLLMQFKLQEKYQDKEGNVLNKLVHKCENLSKKIATMDCN